MRFRPIPVIQRLQQLPDDERQQAIAVMAKQLFSSDGFAIVVDVMRTLEQATLGTLQVSTDPAQTQRLVGGLHMIESIRRSLAALRSTADATPDFYEEGAEEYINPLMEENVER